MVHLGFVPTVQLCALLLNTPKILQAQEIHVQNVLESNWGINDTAASPSGSSLEACYVTVRSPKSLI